LFEVSDLTYLVIGLGFLFMTMIRFFSRPHLPSIPMIYVVAGGLLGFTSLAALVLDPFATKLQLTIIKHVSELIVIIAIAGAGLAIDRRAGLRSWDHTWVLLAFVMPLTMLALVWLGVVLLALPLATAVLLAAVLAPTDPVLARSVQVDGPGQEDEHDTRVALTAEAGLNDGLAFPFVYLAVALTAISSIGIDTLDSPWFHDWLQFDLLYRVVMGLVVGWAIGRALGWLVHSRYGDAQKEAQNAGLVVLATIFLAYGAAEAVEGYGFLAVFTAARAARGFSEAEGATDYIEHPHRFSDQFEKIMLTVILLWLGAYAVGGGLEGLTWLEAGLAAALIFVIRPLVGALCLLPMKGDRLERVAIGSLGIRGIGTVFYLAYAMGEASFENIETVWRISIVAILLSIFVHGLFAPLVMKRISERRSASEAG